MKNRILPIVTIILGVHLSGEAARADIDDALDNMFMVTGSEAAVYESQRRSGVQFGTFRMRAPVSSINIMNFTAPEIRMGCGGIDLYGGSFSFINTEQFRQVLRQIGANAIGYAFKLALATMCDRCDQILTGLQNMMNDTTRMNVDSCRWAKGIVNDSVDALGLKVNEDVKTTDTAAGLYEDLSEAAQDMFADARQAFSRGDPSGADPDNPNVGNLTWNALHGADVDGLFDFISGNVTHEEVLMNIAGTTILRAPDDGEAADGAEGELIAPHLSRLSFMELKKGKSESTADGNDSRRLMKCDEKDQCLKPTELDAWSFEGVDKWVKTKLTEVADHVQNPATANAPHTAEQQAFLGSLPVDVSRHLVELQGSKGLTKYVQIVSPFIGSFYTVALAESMVHAIESAYEQTDAPPMTNEVRDNIAAFRSGLVSEQQQLDESFLPKLQEIEQLVESTRNIENRNVTTGLITAESN